MINTREIATEYRLGHWSKIMQERGESGLSIKAYCESIGIHQNVYHYWQRKLREAACEKLLPEKQTKGTALTQPEGWAVCAIAEPETSISNCVCVEIGKFKVMVKCGDDMDLFADVCRTLVKLC